MWSTKAMFLSTTGSLRSHTANSGKKTRIIPVDERKIPVKNSSVEISDSIIAVKNRTVEVEDRNAPVMK
jgi:hypothetical protein